MKYPFYLLSIILVLVSCSTRDIEDPKEEIHAKEITKEELRIFPDTVREENKELNYKAYILYPEFSPMGSSIDGLRKLSRGFIFNNYTQFKKFIKDFDAINTRYFKGDYIVTHQDEKMISMQVKSEWEVPGTSRILYHQHIINWNLEKDNPIYEKTYFIQKDKYDTFKEMVNNKIKEKCESVPDGIGYRFNVSLEDGIIVEKTNTMDPSECYYPTIIIPWNELEGILTEEGKSFYQ